MPKLVLPTLIRDAQQLSMQQHVPFAFFYDSPLPRSLFIDALERGVALIKFDDLPGFATKVGVELNVPALTEGVMLDIDFKTGGNSLNHVISGLSFPEKNYTWTDGKTSVLDIGILPKDYDYHIQLTISPAIFNGSERIQQVNCLFNDIPITRFMLYRLQTINALIPSHMILNGVSNIFTMHHLDCRRPSDYDMSNDQRELAIAIRHIRVTRQYNL